MSTHENKKQKISTSISTEEKQALDEFQQAKEKVEEIEKKKQKEREEEFKKEAEKLARLLGGKLTKVALPVRHNLGCGFGISLSVLTTDVFLSIDLGGHRLEFIETSDVFDWYLCPKDLKEHNDYLHALTARGHCSLEQVWKNQQKLTKNQMDVLCGFSSKILRFPIKVIKRRQKWEYYV